jgi:acetyl esterase
MLDAAAGMDLTAVPSIEQVRLVFANAMGMADTAPEDVAVVEDRAAGSIAVRVYRPGAAPTPAPALVWYHGGGWVIGNLETADGICRRLANRTDAVVVSVDYRLAPEHPAPAAVDDAWESLCWVASNGPELGVDATRLAVGGDSAGGNLAALVAVKARDAGGPRLRHQLLVYPATDLTRSSASHTEHAVPMFDPSSIGSWFDMYVGGADPGDPSLSPAATADLAGLPPACVITAGFDPLRDEGIAYAERLRDAGVDVEHLHYPSMLHGFYQLGLVTPVAAEATDASCTHLRAALHQED